MSRGIGATSAHQGWHKHPNRQCHSPQGTCSGSTVSCCPPDRQPQLQSLGLGDVAGKALAKGIPSKIQGPQADSHAQEARVSRQIVIPVLHPSSSTMGRVP